jgi:hypothetical protein
MVFEFLTNQFPEVSIVFSALLGVYEFVIRDVFNQIIRQESAKDLLYEKTPTILGEDLWFCGWSELADMEKKSNRRLKRDW